MFIKSTAKNGELIEENCMDKGYKTMVNMTLYGYQRKQKNTKKKIDLYQRFFNRDFAT